MQKSKQVMTENERDEWFAKTQKYLENLLGVTGIEAVTREL